MPKINILSPDIRNLIAAGEVVERPSSVVKELVENSIDAGSSEIKVEICSGGIEKIIVTDDGSGMSPDDMKLSIERHATSKVSRADDLDHISTMGFRGEALPSIAQVSELVIESKSDDSNEMHGYKMAIEAGEQKLFQETGWSKGTRVSISNLFFNVPARRKFLKTPRTEVGHVKDMIQRIALANPEIRFELISDGRSLVKAFSIDDQRQRASEIVSCEAVKNSYKCDEDLGEVRVYGLVGDPAVAKDGTKGMYWFVNRRPVRDRILNHAINEAYRSLLPKGYSPFFILNISLSPDLVDVNVHPTKSEVKFLNGNSIHDLVVKAVRKTLSVQRNSDSTFMENDKVFENTSPEEEVESVGVPDTKQRVVDAVSRYYDSAQTSKPSRSFEFKEESAPTNVQEELLKEGRYGPLKAIGQLHKSYLLCENREGNMVIIDQHAAHERIGYEKLRSEFKDASISSQMLLVPEIVTVPSKSVGYLEESIPVLEKLGWEIEYYGNDSFCIKAYPSLLGNINVPSVVSNIADELVEFGTIDSHEDKIDALMKVTACHAQVRFGDHLEKDEIDALLREMDQFEWSGRCPHGRRAIIEFNLSEIEKWFDRS